MSKINKKKKIIYSKMSYDTEVLFLNKVTFAEKVHFKKDVVFDTDTVFENDIAIMGNLTTINQDVRYIYEDKIISNRWQLLSIFFKSFFNKK